MLSISEHIFVCLINPMVKEPIQISNLVSSEFPSFFKHGRVLYLLPSVLWVPVWVDDDISEQKIELYNQGYECKIKFQFQNTCCRQVRVIARGLALGRFLLLIVGPEKGVQAESAGGV